MAAQRQSLPHTTHSLRASALIVCAAVLSLITTFHLSRWLLEGARWEMVVAWILTGAWMLLSLTFLILLIVFFWIAEVDPTV